MSDKIIVRSPGRINLIGEHTDYNNGYVLPAAINKYLEFTIEPLNGKLIRLEAKDLDESASIDIAKPARSAKNWVNYCVGILVQLHKHNYEFEAFNCSFGGNIPLGAGLSSSAALSCGLLMAINELFDLGIEKIDIARMAQASENDYVGVNCGIMDQYACLFGEENSLVKIDCRSFEHEILPIDFKGYDLLLVDTKVKHSLADGEYNTRREECEAGVRAMQNHRPQISSLRDATIEDLESIHNEVNSDIIDRCTYVINENKRVQGAEKAILRNDLQMLGHLMAESHDGLKNQYKVSCNELDVLADYANNFPGILGARMMGGGFGGCTINLIEANSVTQFKNDVAIAYKQAIGKRPAFYIIKISDGAKVI